MKRFGDRAVAAAFEAYPVELRRRLMALRDVIFAVAARTDGVGPLTETLKWGQPSYLTSKTGSGSTIRIDRFGKSDAYAVFFHCRSGLVDQFRQLYPQTFRYEGRRAIVFDGRGRVSMRALGHCIGLALTHHARKKIRASAS